MANVKAKSNKKAVKAKPSAKKVAAKSKAPTGKAGKTAAKVKPAKKALAKPVQKKKVTPDPLKKAATKQAPKRATKAAAPKPKAASPAKKSAPASKRQPAPKPGIAAKVPGKAKAPAPQAAAAPSAPKAAPANKPAPAKAPVPPTPLTEALPAEKSAPKAAPAKEAKVKAPVVAVLTGLDPLGTPARTLKRPVKERFLVEFYMNATPGSLYDMISSPSGLSEWFCDDVDVRGDHFTFRWGSDERIAQCLSRKFGELMRFQWEDDEDQGAYFELRIRTDPMTNETCLVVIDHEWPKDLDEAKALWGSQIHQLQRVLGA